MPLNKETKIISTETTMGRTIISLGRESFLLQNTILPHTTTIFYTFLQ